MLKVQFMLQIIYKNKMQFFALAIFLVMSVILVMIPSATAEDHDVSITDDMKFNPEDLTINVEDTVTWTNNDGMGHTATSTDGPASFDSGNIAAGATWSFTFTEAGTYNYKCDYHSSMTASITVVESDDGDGDDGSDDGSGTNETDDGDGTNETGESPDSDNDGISDDDDSCPEEDASGHDADADGCIDDSDNDGVKNDVDVCPFDPDDACDAVAAPQNEGECVEGDVKNEDCNSCSCQSDPDGNWAWACTEKDCEAMKEDSPSIGFVVAVISCLLVATRKRN